MPITEGKLPIGSTAPAAPQSDAPCRGLLRILPVAILLAGCSDGFRFPGKPDPDKRFVRPDQVTDFDTLFKQNCRGCHGGDGRKGPAPPLNDPLFLAIVSDADLHMTIEQGRGGYLMPAFAEQEGGHLTTEQIEILVKGIRQRWAKPLSRPRDQLPEYSLADAVKKGGFRGNKEAGAKVFERACAACHGDNGTGGMVGAVNNPDFLALLSNQALRRIVITGRADFGMPDYASNDSRTPQFQPLTSQDIADVVALLESWRRP